jgi:hypothetical protein
MARIFAHQAIWAGFGKLIHPALAGASGADVTRVVIACL